MPGGGVEEKNRVADGVEDSTGMTGEIENAETMEGEKVDNCCICMDSIDTSGKATLVPCNHQYHKKCIDQWFGTGRSNWNCSYCRTSTSQIRHSFKPDGKFETETVGAANDPVRRQIRFLMCIATPEVYMYSLVTESFFTIVNSSSRTIELVDNSQLIQTLEPGAWHQLNDTSLSYNMRFQNEPQIEFTLFNIDNFHAGTVLSPVAQSHLSQTRLLLLQEFTRIEALRNERISPLHGTNDDDNGNDDNDYGTNDDDDDYETPRMRRRRERIERTAQVPNHPRPPPRRRARGRGRRGRGAANQVPSQQP